ncbi:MAG: hypothetical protein ACXV7J_06655 [Methylomonas sp.]
MKTKTIALLIGLLFSANVSAQRVEVDFSLLVDSVSSIQQSSNCISNPWSFGCGINVSDRFNGSFSIDDSVLLQSGLSTGIPVFDFYLSFGNLVYSQDPSKNTALIGFRGLSLNSPGPGIIVENGRIVDLAGGIYGLGDVPYIDFSFYGAQKNRFSAFDGQSSITGELTLSQVSEPGILPLLMMGLLGFMATLSDKRSYRVVGRDASNV